MPDVRSTALHPTARPWRTLVAIAVAMAFLATGLFALVGSAGPASAATTGDYPLGDGYWLVASDGGIFSYGNAQFEGSTGKLVLNKPVVGGAALPYYEGYWFVASDGGVFSYGGAFYGSMGGSHLNQPVVGMAAHASGDGYWLVATDGGIFSYGASKFHGSMGGSHLNKPIVGMAATPSGNGYWLVASDGGIFSYGDAGFYGSMGGSPLNQPIVGMAPTADGLGYWMVAKDGGIFSFGDAKYYGSAGSQKLTSPVVGMAAAPHGDGYWLTTANGLVLGYGNPGFLGGTGTLPLKAPVVGIMPRPKMALKVDPFADATGRSSTWNPSALALSWNGSGAAPAGAHVDGVEGLAVEQLDSLRFADLSGTCAGSPQLNLYVDTNGDGTADDMRVYACSAGGAGTYKSFDPVAGATGAAPLPRLATVIGLDVQLGAAGSTTLDDIQAVQIVVHDYRTYTADGRALG